MNILLFTDLDGTFIDHHTYSPAYARKALNMLEGWGVPTIFCSSKTFSEQVYLQNKVGINHPFIVENGSAIAIPKDYFPFPVKGVVEITDSHDLLVLSKFSLTDIVNAFAYINKTLNVNLYGYTKTTDIEIAAKTGLKGKAVFRARERYFTESLFSGPPGPDAMKILDQLGLCTIQGGRFLTVQDKAVDKGKAVGYVTGLFQKFWEIEPLTVGIGDSPNDFAFLKLMDQAFLVQQFHGGWADLHIPEVKKIAAVGSAGFREAVQSMQAIFLEGS